MNYKQQQKALPISKYLLRWYSSAKRDLPWRKTTNPYHIWVSEVMLQQTQVKTVLPYYETFLKHFPTINILAQSPLEDVLSIWQGLGYYSRARHLWEGAKYVLKTWEGTLPQEYEELLTIPGVGAYTAGAVASIAFQKRVPAIDGNVQRVLARFLAWPHPIENSLSRKTFRLFLLEWLPNDNPGDFNQALMELGATVCTPKHPQCPNCPLNLWCQAFAENDYAYPLKRSKLPPVEVTRLTFVLMHEDELFLQQRPEKGLLAGMWELPGKEIIIDKTGEFIPDFSENIVNAPPKYTPQEWFSFYQTTILNRTYDAQVLRKFEQNIPINGPVCHTFSHLRWRMYWVLIELDELNPIDVPAVFPDMTHKIPDGKVLEEKSLYGSQEESTPFNSENPEPEPEPLVFRERWVSQNRLADIPIPSAFRGILKHLC